MLKLLLISNLIYKNMSENKNEFETIDFADENFADKKEILKWDVKKNIFNDFDSDASLQVELFVFDLRISIYLYSKRFRILK